MKTFRFKDRKAREYTLSLNLRTVREMQKKLPIDITSEADWQNLMASRADQLTYIWYLVEDQADAYGLDVDKWEQAMYGEGVASAACDAFMRVLENFYQKLDLMKMARMQEAIRPMMMDENRQWSDPDTVKNLQKVTRAVTAGQMSSSGQQSPE